MKQRCHLALVAAAACLCAAAAAAARDPDEYPDGYRAGRDEAGDAEGYSYGAPADLPLIVDYANMIRNDIILLDNSVQTQTRKRGVVDPEKDFTDNTECSCEVIKKIVDLGVDYFPRYVESRACRARAACPPRRDCRDAVYHITVLKKKRSTREASDVEVPRALNATWLGVRRALRVGCSCRPD